MSSSDPQSIKQISQALTAGDLLTAYIDASVEQFSEAKVLDILKSCGAEGLTDIETFRNLLTSDVNFPTRLFSDIGAALIKAGLPQERAFQFIHIRKVPSRTIAKMNAVIFAEMSMQDFNPEPLDLICSSMVSCGVYNPFISNAIIGDAIIEEVRGATRKARLITVSLDPDGQNWFWLNHMKWCGVYCPTNMGEPKAEAKVVHGDDFTIRDPHHPDMPLRLPAKPSLQEIAQRHDIEMKVDGNIVYFNQQPVAMLDDCPGRTVTDIYRMIQDVKLDGTRLVIEKPKTKIRFYHSLLLANEHRYHLTRSYPAFEIEIEFTINRLKQRLMTTAIIGSRKLWQLIIPGGANPWMQLYNLLDKSGEASNWKLDRYFRSYCQPRMPSGQLSEAAKLDYFKLQFDLSKRETEVLGKILQGKSNLEIATECDITEMTVKSHVSNVLSKTGLPNRQKLITSLMSNRPE